MDVYCHGAFDLVEIVYQLNRAAQPNFTLTDLRTVCGIVCDAAAKLGCRSKALERVDGQYEYTYMYNKRAVEQVMEEAQSEAELAEVEVEDELPEVEEEAGSPSNYT